MAKFFVVRRISKTLKGCIILLLIIALFLLLNALQLGTINIRNYKWSTSMNSKSLAALKPHSTKYEEGNDNNAFLAKLVDLSISSSSVTQKENKNNWKKIVIWTNYFRDTYVWEPIFRRITAGACEESRCTISLDKNSAETADAVLFNAMDLSYERKLIPTLPPRRHPNQTYIFYSMEPPPRLPRNNFYMLRDYFNWTMTYRKDSDIYEPFGLVKKRDTPRKESRFVTQEELDKKKKVLWIISNCFDKPKWARDFFVRDLNKSINIDIIGSSVCGKKCDSKSGNARYGDKIGDSECEKYMTDYAFYLALENSNCNDYVTEKIYKAWIMGVVPIVMGAVNYSAIAPPKSYIDQKDFESASALADYLMEVSSDAKLYNEYFEWHKYYDVDVGSPYSSFTCDLCKKLHSHTPCRANCSYSNLVNWFWDKSSCHSGYAAKSIHHKEIKS